MPVVGLIGGIAPESTVDYYRRIVAQYCERRGNGEYPRIVVNSINLNTLLEFVSTERLEELTTYLLGELARLARARADFGLLASNTPHIVFDRLSPQSPIPLLSIVEATAARSSGGADVWRSGGHRVAACGSGHPAYLRRRRDHHSAVSSSWAHSAAHYHARSGANRHRSPALWPAAARYCTQARRDAPVRQRPCSKRVCGCRLTGA